MSEDYGGAARRLQLGSTRPPPPRRRRNGGAAAPPAAARRSRGDNRGHAGSGRARLGVRRVANWNLRVPQTLLTEWFG